ncbi:glutaredoxin family protein [bacterium]|nr:glutaredoxin family protein [bacterium]
MRVTFYTKPDCLLCETVRMELLDLQWDVNFQLDELDITSDEILHARYFLEIPVVEIRTGDELMQLKAPISQIELRRQLKRLAGQE